MSADQEQNDYDDDFVEDGIDDLFELDFNNTKAIRKQHKLKSRKDARRRIDDYFERKALKENEDNWDYNLDY